MKYDSKILSFNAVIFKMIENFKDAKVENW